MDKELMAEHVKAGHVVLDDLPPDVQEEIKAIADTLPDKKPIVHGLDVGGDSFD